MNATFMRMACASAFAILPVLAQAQDKVMVMERHVTATASGNAADVIQFIGMPTHLEGGQVKGAPYSAEAVSETVQQLANGNRIVRKNSNQIYRDSEGRTRREETLSGVGPWASSGGTKTFISISDPTTNTFYHLDPDTKTARKMGVRTSSVTMAGAPGNKVAGKQVQVMVTAGVPLGGATSAATNVQISDLDTKNARTEDLGQKMVEGVMARGSRTTVTIPVGAIGNEQPIETVTERWYSEELKVVLMTRSNDPRFGDTTYRLTNIRRAEPPVYLFQVPTDYKLDDEPTPGPDVKVMQFEKR